MRTVKTASGATAVQVVHSNRRGSRTIDHIGSAHNEQELAALKKAVVPPESWRTPLCGFELGECGVLVVDRTHHPDRAVATLVIVEAVAPLQHDRLRLHDSMELVA